MSESKMYHPKVYLDDPNVGKLEKEYLSRCIDSTFISTHGPFVPEFEEKFADFLNCNKAVALQTGTAGLHMALYELGIGEGDEVIMSVLTFVATANAVKYVGARPVFVDVDPLTWNMNTALVKESINDKTKGIITVHLFGNPCAMDEIVHMARQHNLSLIEDATESLCARYRGRFTGTFGDFGVFSFNGNKVITTGGGGMILGKDEERIKHIKFLVNQARDEKRGYYHPEVGFNYRMTNIEAAIGLAQLERLLSFVEKKRHFYEIYTEMFKGIDELQLQQPYDGSESMWWLTSLIIDTDTIGQTLPEIQMKLKERGIPTRRIFMPLVEFPPYFQNNTGKYGQAYRIYEQGLNLPSSTLNNDESIEFTAEAIIDIIGVA